MGDRAREREEETPAERQMLVARAATRQTEGASLRARWLFVPAVALGLCGCAVALLDLAYVVSVGGQPTNERAAEMNGRAAEIAGAGWVAFLLATGAFSRWYQTCLRAAATCGATVRPVEAVFLLRPYAMLRVLDEALDPDRMAPRPARPATTDHAGGYRAAAAAPATVSRVGAAPLLAWWLLWLSCSGILVFRWIVTVSWTTAKALDATANAANVAATLLAAVIVLRTTQRLLAWRRMAFPEE